MTFGRGPAIRLHRHCIADGEIDETSPETGFLATVATT